jgi:hypothetical protein
MKHARACECILQPGELLFVPAGSPHYVTNLTDTVAVCLGPAAADAQVSGNYIDASNIELVKVM